MTKNTPLTNKISLLFHRLFIRETNHTGVQFLRYGVVAGILFITDFSGLYFFTTELHMFYLLSATLSFTLSTILNYILSVRWVFRGRVNRQRHIELILFIIICAVALGLNDLFMWIFTSKVGLFYLWSKLLTVALVSVWSFGARILLFHPKRFQRFFKSDITAS
ncbi:MAG TPA: GtrA family protein [Candidatus Saccharimonas sp.]|nr:GtrA family protein [Candidatus Saccharimonas sp.]